MTESSTRRMALAARIHDVLNAPKRAPWRAAVASRDLAAMKTALLDALQEGLAKPDASVVERSDKSGSWLGTRCRADSSVASALRLPLETSEEEHAFVFSVIAAAEPFFGASPLEVLLRAGKRLEFKTACAALAAASLDRAPDTLRLTWSASDRTPYALTARITVARPGAFYVVFGDLFSLAFLLGDGEAYTDMLAAGASDQSLLDAVGEFFGGLGARPEAAEQLNGHLASLGYPVKSPADWLSIADFRLASTESAIFRELIPTRTEPKRRKNKAL